MTDDPRLTNVDAQHVEELHALQLEVDRAEDAVAWADDRLLAYVAVLRREGWMTWDEIGAVLGVSRQAAHERFAARVRALTEQEFVAATGALTTNERVEIPIEIPGLDIKPTPSMIDGTSLLTQCAQCGLLAVVPDCGQYGPRDSLADCPRCGRGQWWRQDFPCGPFAVRSSRLPS